MDWTGRLPELKESFERVEPLFTPYGTTKYFGVYWHGPRSVGSIKSPVTEIVTCILEHLYCFQISHRSFLTFIDVFCRSISLTNLETVEVFRNTCPPFLLPVTRCYPPYEGQ